MIKKAAIIVCLILAVLAFGVQTYSWFSSKANSINNSFQAGTPEIQINGETVDDSGNAMLFNNTNLEPGQIVPTTTITVLNTGTLDLFLQNTEVEVEFTDKDGNSWTDTEEFFGFRIKRTYFNNGTYDSGDRKPLLKTSSEIEGYLTTYFDYKHLSSPYSSLGGGYIIIETSPYLNESAGGDCAGVSAVITLSLKAKQVIP